MEKKLLKNNQKLEENVSKYFSENNTVFSWWDPENPKMKDNYSDKDRFLFLKERKIILDFLKNHDIKSFLEVGSGRGRFSLSLSIQHPNSFIIGIDLSSQMVEFANNLALQKNIKNVKFIIGNGMNLKFEDNSFDTVLCIQVLMHIPNPDLLLSELKRVVKPNGFIIIDQLNSDHSWRTNLRGRKNRIFVPIKEFISYKILRKICIMYRMKEEEFKELIKRNRLYVERYTTLGLENNKPVYFLSFCQKL